MFVKIRSWHIVASPTRVPNRYLTLCGRNADGPTAESFGTEKSCEQCLRVKVARE